MFKKASRLKLRFESPKGNLTVEDLWDIPLTSKTGVSLDSIAVELYNKLKQGSEISFVVNVNKSDDITKLKFEIVKHIIDVRMEEQAHADQARAIKAQRSKILEIKAQKQDARLLDASIEELDAMLEQLQ